MYVPIVSRHLAGLGLAGAELASWTGIAFAANFLAMMIMLPILGRLGDRIGRKPIMVWSGLGMAVVTSVMTFAGHPAELAALRFLQGCFTGILPFSNVLVLTGAPRHRIGFSAGLMQMMGESGQMLGPIIGAAAMTALAPKETFPLMSLLLAIGTLLVMLLVREPPRQAAPETGTTRLVQDIAAIWPFGQSSVRNGPAEWPLAFNSASYPVSCTSRSCCVPAVPARRYALQPVHDAGRSSACRTAAIRLRT